MNLQNDLLIQGQYLKDIDNSEEKKIIRTELPLKSKILLTLCVMATIIFFVPFIVNLIYTSVIYIFAPAFTACFLISILGIYKRKKYGYILASVVSAIVLILSIINIYEFEIVFYGIILILAIIEYRAFKSKDKIIIGLPNIPPEWFYM